MLISAASVPPDTDGLCPRGPPGPPPPLLPKPGKDNLRLQRLLRRAARKDTAAAGPSAPPGAFRSSLSPVSEASHDQEPAAPRPTEAPRVVATLSHTPVIQHVVSSLQKSTLSFSFTQHRSLVVHSEALGPQLAAPGPAWAPSDFASVSAPAAGAAHSSQAHIPPGPSPQAGAPELPRRGPGGGSGGQDRDAAPRPPGAQPSIPVAHIRPLPTGAQAGRPWPQAPHGSQASGPRGVRPRAVVPIAPTYRSPGPSPPRPGPVVPEAECVEEPPMAGPAAETKPVSGLQGPPPPASQSDPNSCPMPKAAPKARCTGWVRLKKQLTDEVKELPFPGPGPSPEWTAQGVTAPSAPVPGPPASRASRLWDAVLYRVAVAESHRGPAGPRDGACGLAGLSRLPCLCRPRFNARKLQEAATRPPPATHAVVLERSPQPRDFNRTAVGWQPH